MKQFAEAVLCSPFAGLELRPSALVVADAGYLGRELRSPAHLFIFLLSRPRLFILLSRYVSHLLSHFQISDAALQ